MSTRHVWNRYDFTIQSKTQNHDSNQYIVSEVAGLSFVVASEYNGPHISPEFSKIFGYYTPGGNTSTISSAGTYTASAAHRYLFTPSYSSSVGEVSNQKVAVLFEAVQSITGVEGAYWQVGMNGGKLTAKCTNGYIERWIQYTKGSEASKISAAVSSFYPDDNYSGDYWYTYQGSDSIDPSAVSYSKNNPSQGESITVSVTPVSNTYGGTISYQYQYSTNGGTSWTNSGSKTAAASKAITVPANAAQFQVRVLASDDMGFTSTTYVAGDNLAVTPGNRAPSAPASVTAKETSSQTFTVSWTASTDPDGNLAGYQIERSYDGSNWSSVSSVTVGTSLTDTVASGSTSVIYRVRAFDTEGLYSAWTTSSSSTLNRPPTAPGSVMASETSPQTFAVSWTASTDPDGNLAGYQVERSCNNGSSWSTVTNSVTGTSLTDKVAAGNTSVIYRVRAFDTAGLYSVWTTSAASAVSNAPTMPASISLPALINVGENFTIRWAASSDPDGNLTGYQVEKSFDRGATWTSAADVVKQTSLEDIAAAGNATVIYRVRAVDAGGLYSSWRTSAASTINTAPSAPASVSLPDVINIGKNYTVSWSAAADAENNVTRYEVEKSYDDGVTWSSVSNTATGTSITATETAGGAVRYRVCAIDAGGLKSGWTVSQNTLVNLPPAPPPEIVVGTVRLGEYTTIVWHAAADSDGMVTSYTLQRSVDGGNYETIYSGTALTCTDRADNRSWEHVQYRVQAVDDRGGISEWTASEVRQIEPGRLYLVGPGADMGRVFKSFAFIIAVQTGGEYPVDGIQVVFTLDGEEMLRNTVGSGEEISAFIDLWIVESGTHTITVIASKERYTEAVGTYRFTVVPIELGTGGRLERLENRNGQAVYPITLMEGIFRRRDGKSLEDILDGIGTGSSGGGVTDHQVLTSRDAADQHPIEAVTGLAEELERIPEPLTKEKLDELLKFDGVSGNAAFYVDPATGSLHMVTDDNYAGPQFRLVNGNLEVVYG